MLMVLIRPVSSAGILQVTSDGICMLYNEVCIICNLIAACNSWLMPVHCRMSPANARVVSLHASPIDVYALD